MSNDSLGGGIDGCQKSASNSFRINGPGGSSPYPEHHFSAGTQGSWNLTNQSLRRTCRNMFQDSVKRAQNSFDLKTSTGVVKIKW